ncbi:trypsin-like peptidase domain-containing protein [Paenibacillus sp. YPG26]|uniref:S1C family serine protease n=1 Tax=Paenibacillus sp. YPG26 TaxID=2878915 RepID=UPI002040EDCF|nr:trypsin-like peptidase domain-containing protein [Paenibacillus sp. YPG26]USB32798.1 trypsin-like peptidase domain-containing protein [Paenibacillus sp. YPG26]
MRVKSKAAVGLLLSTAIGLSGSLSVSAESNTKGSLKESASTVAVKIKSTAKTEASKSKATGETSTPNDIIPQIIKKVSPSVVGIIGRAANAGSKNQGDNRYNLAHGTGVIYRSDGWIVTNTHVVQGLTNALVVTSDGKSYSIAESYEDEVSDIALIKINAKNLQPAKFAVSSQNVLVGEKVIALGTPISFSLRNSATQGIVSGLNRAVNAAYRLIQTDTAINPGNSGGPLLNMKGEVIGINSMKFEAVGVENMGFSIPTETVQYVVRQLFKYGEVNRPSLGVSLEESWPSLVGLPGDDPLTITKVNSPEAQKAGLQAGDVLYRVNGKKISSIVDLNELLKSFIPGQTVTLWLESGGDIVTRKLVLSKDTGLSTDTGSEGDEA